MKGPSEYDGPVEPLKGLMDRCVRCGFCNATCPTYLESGLELEGPRGRIQLIRAALDARPVTRKTQQHLDHCLTCLACETTCPSGVRYRDIIDQGRGVLEARVKRPLLERWGRRGVARLVGWPRVIGAGFFLGRGLRSILPERFQPYLKPPRRFQGRGNVSGLTARGGVVLLIEGCIQRSLAPAFDAALEEILCALGYGVERVLGGSCCGAVAQHLGEPLLAERQRAGLVHALLRRLSSHDQCPVEAVMMSSSGCGLCLKEAVSAIGAEGPQGLRVLDPLEFMEDHLGDLRTLLQPRRDNPRPLVIHEPCSLQHGWVGGERLTRFLTALGFDVRADLERSLCCGAGGTHALFYPELAASLKAKKRRALGLDEGGLALSSNIGCILHLGGAAEVDHWVCVLARQLNRSPRSP